MTRFSFLSLILLVIISGCESQPGQRTPTRPIESPVDQLLGQAELNYRNNQLTTPSDDNALLKFQAVLALDPGNVIAQDGINRIVEKYLAWARDHAESGNLSKARVYVSRAESVDATHPNIVPVVNLINDREDLKTMLFTLDRQAVLRRNAKRIDFESIARAIVQKQAFVTIRAPDDASGRWLYQELNKRVSFRVEAAFNITSTPSIVLTR